MPPHWRDRKPYEDDEEEDEDDNEEEDALAAGVAITNERGNKEMTDDNLFKELEPIASTPVAPAVGIAAVALNMALKYHDISTVQDGTLYQQYKLEGKNLTALHLDMVFETAIKIEAYLLGASDRIAKIVVDAIAVVVDEDEEKTNDPDRT